jgi:hypothetical protein
MSGTGAPRVSCCVPGCRRSFGADRCDDGDGEFMCGRCLKLADGRLQQRRKQLKERMRKVLRLTTDQAIHALGRRAFARGRARVIAFPIINRRLEAAFNANWAAIKRDAEIKLAMGAEGAPRRRKAA